MIRTLSVALLAPLLAFAAPAAAGCKLALVLGLDISSSVNAREYAIQLGGLADAFRKLQVQEAILTPQGASVAVMAFEWSGQKQQSVIADWTLLDSPASIAAFADRLNAHRRTASTLPTAVGQALSFAAEQFRRAPPCTRRTVDISGDGENNDGPTPNQVRATGALAGLTVNGLVIQGAYPNPAIFYRAQVMQGPDAFVALARDFDDYPAVI
ncbi:MAG: DUF1194 domain-containing protein, partial [Pseudomonadota bacterium]